jgi:hypothetical protein
MKEAQNIAKAQNSWFQIKSAIYILAHARIKFEEKSAILFTRKSAFVVPIYI